MKNILLTGSIAYDHLMSFDGYFKDSLIDGKLDNISLSFFASKHEVYFGGCAANIAYSLKLLGENPVILGVAGNDFKRYEDWLLSCGISVSGICIDESSPTASANILTDMGQNQLTIFSPGAMQEYEGDIKLKGDNIFDLAIVSPEMPHRMKYFARYFLELGVPYIFDPGQALPALSSDDLEGMISSSIGVILNEYEAEILMQKLGKSLEELVVDLQFIVKTCGENGCELYRNGSPMKKLDAASGLNQVDSTGCGDTFRAAFIYSFTRDESLEECCRNGNAKAAATLAFMGTQNHKFN